MSNSTIVIKDSNSAAVNLAADTTNSVVTPYHLEDTGQRAALLAALAALTPATGGATAALQSTGNTSLASILTAITGSLTVVGPVTLSQLLGALLKADTVVQSTSTSRSATIGTTAQVLMAANTARRGFTVQNQSTTASVYINGLATATADNSSLLIGPGGFFESSSHHSGTGAISIIATAASTPVYSREF